MKIRSKVLLLFFFGALLCSCAKDDYEPSVQWFKFNCRNTQRSFNVDFSLRISVTYKDETLPVMLEILSPSAFRFRETLKIPVKKLVSDGLTTVVRSGVGELYSGTIERTSVSITGRWLVTIYFRNLAQKRGKLKVKLKLQ
jgi:hypothetical protein